jgi:hypothetical protein
VLDHVTDRLPTLTQAWLRRLHEEIVAPQETYVVHTPVGRTNVTIEVEKVDGYKGEPLDGYRAIRPAGAKSVRLTFKADKPADVDVPRRFDVFVSKDLGPSASLLVQGVQMADEKLVFKRSELRPQISSVAQRRAENLIKRALGDGLAALRDEVSAKLGST